MSESNNLLPISEIIGILDGELVVVRTIYEGDNTTPYLQVLTFDTIDQAYIDRMREEEHGVDLWQEAVRAGETEQSLTDWWDSCLSYCDGLYPDDDASYRDVAESLYNRLPDEDRKKLEAVFGTMVDEGDTTHEGKTFVTFDCRGIGCWDDDVFDEASYEVLLCPEVLRRCREWYEASHQDEAKSPLCSEIVAKPFDVERGWPPCWRLEHKFSVESLFSVRTVVAGSGSFLVSLFACFDNGEVFLQLSQTSLQPLESAILACWLREAWTKTINKLYTECIQSYIDRTGDVEWRKAKREVEAEVKKRALAIKDRCDPQRIFFKQTAKDFWVPLFNDVVFYDAGAPQASGSQASAVQEPIPIERVDVILEPWDTILNGIPHLCDVEGMVLESAPFDFGVFCTGPTAYGELPPAIFSSHTLNTLFFEFQRKKNGTVQK